MRTLALFLLLCATATATDLSRVSVELWTAKWCGQCPVAYSVVKSLEKEGYSVVIKDFTTNRKEAHEKGVSALPTAFVSLDGVKLKTLVGSKEITKKAIKSIKIPEKPKEPKKPKKPKWPNYYLIHIFKPLPPIYCEGN